PHRIRELQAVALIFPGYPGAVRIRRVGSGFALCCIKPKKSPARKNFAASFDALSKRWSRHSSAEKAAFMSRVQVSDRDAGARAVSDADWASWRFDLAAGQLSPSRLPRLGLTHRIPPADAKKPPHPSPHPATFTLIEEFFDAISAGDSDKVRSILTVDRSVTKEKLKGDYKYDPAVELDAYKFLGSLTGLQSAILLGADAIAKDIIDYTFQEGKGAPPHLSSPPPPPPRVAHAGVRAEIRHPVGRTSSKRAPEFGRIGKRSRGFGARR
ncbi:MAG: hypothetical protein BJ554DRAFT_3239, partial [Olpidium bornovanus]